MTVEEIREALQGELICGADCLKREIHSVCGSDMMSDVLAYVKDQSVLLTGLCNPQVIRTADMMDIVCVVFVRGKAPSTAMIEMAEEHGIVLLTTSHRMFTACGRLYALGLRGGEQLE